MITNVRSILGDFSGQKRMLHERRRKTLREEKHQRENLSEKQIDKMVMDSFPASDPPSTY